MNKTLTIMNLPEQANADSKAEFVFEYSDILNLFNLNYEPAEYYWQVGEIKNRKGWILHISVIRSQLPELLQVVLPELLSSSVSFTVIRDYMIAGSLAEGNLGYENMGKMLSIFPEDDNIALSMAKILISLTKDFRGPVIRTSIPLGSNVYTDYRLFPAQTGRNLGLLQVAEGHPENIPWPFQELASPSVPKTRKILNDRYYPLKIIKADAKGDVIRAIYFKKPWQIKPCLIKQGRQDMFADEYGRDIRDRLQWQYDLYHELAPEIPIPVIFDYFTISGDSYLAMEFVKGTSLSTWINVNYQHRIWQDLPKPAKLLLLDKLLEILTIINHLHEKGYIHRDITPENFLIDRQSKITLIDMELTWSIHSGKPSPPFTLGTPGYMSPEQYNHQTPTLKDDIYGLGALMIVFFSNSSPVKFNVASASSLEDQVSFLTGERSIGRLIADCQAFNPNLRPELWMIQQELGKYRMSIQQQISGSADISLEQSVKEIEAVVQAGILGLSLPMLLTPKLRWASRLETRQDEIGNEQSRMTVYEGWYTGISGPLWLVALAKKAGFNVDPCLAAYDSSFNYLKENYTRNLENTPDGLYAGKAGIAMAISGGMNSGLLSPDSQLIEWMYNCFTESDGQLNISSGVAGKGLSLLQCANSFNKELTERCLTIYVDAIVKSQLTDGSWAVLAESGKKNDIIIGLNDGVAGVILFLLMYIEYRPDSPANTAARKGLEWLIRKAKKKGNSYSWTTSTKSHKSDKWGCGKGIPGILLVFTNAYEILQAPLYRKIVEDSLSELSARPMLADFTLGTGLAGLGEVYLEAYRAFRNNTWKERAQWIAQLFIQFFQETKEDTGFWMAHPSNTVMADLFSDNSGIIHFLMHCAAQDDSFHPLTVRSIEPLTRHHNP